MPYNPQNYTGSLPTRPALRDLGSDLIPGAFSDVDFLNALGPLIQQIVLNLVHSSTQAGMAADAQRIQTAGASQARRTARGTSDPNLARDLEFEGVNQANLAAQNHIAQAFSPEGAYAIAQNILGAAGNPALTARLQGVGDINNIVSTSNVQKSPKSPGALGSILGFGAQLLGAGGLNPASIATSLFANRNGNDGSNSSVLPAVVGAAA